ncbi:Nramp family divalent metal transporter [Flavonifractor hominis]|uniref:Nramp family divalent metal transporter n=1 Tax=Flavonifractor hominis TaxID=3133178 RepID=A0ABV1ESG0_9FIRM
MKKSFAQRMKNMGPAAIITSAFIGPGTITTCTVAGVSFGYALLWAVVFSGIALVILMEMSARTTLATGMNLVDSSTAVAPENQVWKWIVRAVFFLTVLAVCFAFQAGNEIGAARGLADIVNMPIPAAALIIGACALATTWLGSYKTLETIMQIFVSLMGVLFLITAIVIRPDWGAVLRGIIPSLPEGSTVSALALIGTTMVGINLIVHSISCEEKYHSLDEMGDAKFDIGVNILIGVVITLSMLITSATVLYQSGTEVSSPLVFTQSLEPVLGSWARIIGDIGLLAAGLSSAVAVSYTMRSIYSRLFKWEGGSTSMPAKILGTIVIAFGTAFAMFSKTPTQIIVVAQAVSGFSLPFIAIVLMAVANSKKLMGDYRNKLFSNVVGLIAVAVTLFLGLRNIYNVLF